MPGTARRHFIAELTTYIPSWHRLRRGGVAFPKTRQRLAGDLLYLFTVMQYTC